MAFGVQQEIDAKQSWWIL